LDKVSGISIGMIEGNKSKKFLVDIAENEDFYCYMDMKVVSTKLGIVSCQLDVKNMGIDIKSKYTKDLLDRDQEIEILTPIIEKVNSSLVLAVNAPCPCVSSLPYLIRIWPDLECVCQSPASPSIASPS
jgi:hypothetical protein